ncbi:MAG: apolipoprotein N-acyltransferase [Treponema sp.]|nr:apolipoprotein N-acyltransferase [Treponema sp.]
METKNSWIKIILFQLALTILASVLFAASFPNIIFKNGLSFLAWFAYIPILIVIYKNNLLACAGWGALYGFIAYGLFNYWLGNFHPLAGTIVYSIYLVYMAVVFVLLKLAIIFFPKHGFLVQWVIWLAYEYLRTKGFLGYSYGITGYSQWRMIPLIQIASITGVWGVSALVAFPSFWLAEVIKEKPLQINLRQKISGIIWLAALVATLTFGFINMKDFSGKAASGAYPSANIALIQHNTDPWAASRAPAAWQVTEIYRRDLNSLIRLSDEALITNPKPQLVVWPETAFIPRIYWHTTYRDDQNSWALVRQLLEYLAGNEVPFLIGNDDARMDSARNRVDYNAAMLYERGLNTATYRKIHLVPFTEHFPYQKQFPRIHDWLKNADTHFWEKGDEETVFSVPGFTFSAPICFEDTFGYISRNFVRRGADVLVNLSNDAWSDSLPAQYQHLTMAVFRSVENYRPMVRSTSTGQTCAIDSNGRIIAMAPPFMETSLNVTIPLTTKTTIYTKYGDYFAVFFTILAFMLLLSGAVWCTIRKLKREP